MTKSLDYLLVNPSTGGVYHKEQEKSNYPGIEPPYLAALTATVVRDAGYNPEILDANADGLSAEDAAKKVYELKPKYTHVVVHGNQPSASSQLMGWVNSFSRNIKEGGTDTKIILTGTHPAALPEMTLKESSIDFVGGGEGFFTALDLLSGKDLKGVQGLWYKEGKNVLRGPLEKRMNPEEMSKVLRQGAWDLLPMDKYRAHDWHCLDTPDERQPYASMYSGFGCGFACAFCCINAPFTEQGTVKSKIRNRDSKIVVDEIQLLREKYGIKNLKFIDEMFVFDRSHYLGIANGLIERGLNDGLNIWAYARVDTVKEGHLETLRKAGFNWLVLGIESGSKHVRDGVEKGRFGGTDIMKTVRSVQNAGIRVLGNYIFGLPDDTMESMQATLDLATELNCERPNFYSAMAYPGSELHRLAVQRKLPLPPGYDPKRPLLPEEEGGPGWIGYSQHAFETYNLPTAHLHSEQVLAFRDKSLSYYTSEPYAGMVERKFGPKVREMFCEVNAKVPKRKILGHTK
ncbi:MAG: radical SAM protein [Nanoarchaeota archaeon]|nr:radical SAM protein [Nanoarchaeota archaeon]